MIKIKTILKLVAMIIFSVLGISLSMLILLLTFNKSIPVRMARSIWGPGILFLAGAKSTVKGLKNIDKSKSYIVMSNHLSFLDIPLLFKSLPINLYFIGMKELKKLPFVGWYMRATGMIFIDRGNSAEALKSIEDAVELISKGKSVVIFPEGGIKEGENVKSFKKGGFRLAHQSKVEILPIAINGTKKIWNPNNNMSIKKGKVNLRIGKSISLNGYSYRELNLAMKETKEIIEALLES